MIGLPPKPWDLQKREHLEILSRFSTLLFLSPPVGLIIPNCRQKSRQNMSVSRQKPYGFKSGLALSRREERVSGVSVQSPLRFPLKTDAAASLEIRINNAKILFFEL